MSTKLGHTYGKYDLVNNICLQYCAVTDCQSAGGIYVSSLHLFVIGELMNFETNFFLLSTKQKYQCWYHVIGMQIVS